MGASILKVRLSKLPTGPPSGVNKTRQLRHSMAEDEEPSLGEDVGAGVTFFIAGLAVSILFLAVAQGGDLVSFFVILGAFAACIVFGEYYMTLTSGVAFGVGLVMASLASFDWWCAGLAVVATLVNIGRYASTNANGLDASVGDEGQVPGSQEDKPQLVYGREPDP